MRLPKIASFLLWALTFFTLTGFLMAMRIPPLEPLNHIVELDVVSYSQSDVRSLFQANVTTSAEANGAAFATANSSMRLLGIIFSKSHAQSHAVLQGNDGVSRRYIVGSQLPNGARLVDISKRQITYEFDGIQTHLALPPVKP